MILRDVNKVNDDNINDNNDDVIIIDNPVEEEVETEVKKGINVSSNEEISNYESNQPFFKNKWVRYGVIAGAILIFIVIFILIFSSCNASKLKGFDMTKIPVLYVDEEFDFKIVPTEDIEKRVKYKFTVKDGSIADVKYKTLKGKSVKNTIIPSMAGETSLEVEAGKASSNSKIIVCNRLSKDLTENEVGVKLNKTVDLELGLGESPECYEDITVKSSDESIVEVDGISVKGKKAGNTTVTVSDGKEEIEIKVKVTTKNIYVTSLVAEDDNISLKVGDSKQLKVNIKPTDATNKELKWSSSDDSIVDVDKNGVVKAKGAGSAVIKAEADDGSGKTVNIKVVVTKVNNPSSTGSSSEKTSTGSSSGKPSTGKQPTQNKTTYYEYRTKTVTPVATEMCNYYNAKYVEEYFYSVNTSFDTSNPSLSNTVGIRLQSTNAKNISISGNAGKEYYNYNTYCNQRVKNAKVYWPTKPSNAPSSCSGLNADAKYMVPSSYITYLSVGGNVAKGSAYANGYQFSYSLKFNVNSVSSFYNKYGDANIPVRFLVKYYDVSTTLSSAKCSSLNSAQAKFITRRFNKTDNVVSYSGYKWTSNPNLSNAEYTGRTKVE